MKNLPKIFLCCVPLLVILWIAIEASTANAQAIETTDPANNRSPTEYLNAVPLNSDSSLLTFRLDNPQGWSLLILHVDYTWANNGALTLTCQSTDTSDFSKLYDLQVCDNSSGTCTLNDSGVWVTTSLTASKKFSFPIGILGYRNLQCSIAHGGSPAAGDIVTITGYLVTQ